MQVVSGPTYKRRVHFEAPPATRLPAEIADFLLWFETDQALDPLIKAGLAHLWFVTIHPFDDGNGRIARAIGDLALARADQSKLLDALGRHTLQCATSQSAQSYARWF